LPSCFAGGGVPPLAVLAAASDIGNRQDTAEGLQVRDEICAEVRDDGNAETAVNVKEDGGFGRDGAGGSDENWDSCAAGRGAEDLAG
jgi:hypothetical protein